MKKTVLTTIWRCHAFSHDCCF